MNIAVPEIRSEKPSAVNWCAAEAVKFSPKMVNAVPVTIPRMPKQQMLESQPFKLENSEAGVEDFAEAFSE